MNNRVGIPILESTRWRTTVVRQPHTLEAAGSIPAPATTAPLPTQILIKRDSPILCATSGCRLPGVYLREDGPCCPDCLPALLVAEHRAETSGRKYLYDEVPA